MKFSTLNNNSADGVLVLVSADATQCVPTSSVVPTLQVALENWTSVSAELQALQNQLNTGTCKDARPFNASEAMAPLPRAWQWLDGSAFKSHGDLMDIVFNMKKDKDPTRPLMYQGISHQFVAPCADVPLPSADDGIDFEGEFGVITDAVPMGVSKQDALSHIKLLVIINDWSLRRIAPIEMKTGFGWIQAKPACSMAPIAVTPDEIGDAWRDARFQMRLQVDLNGKRFGAAHGGAMSCGFDDLIAHAAYSRNLVAGTVIGSGTVSNDSYREIGSSCIAERRGIEIVDSGAASTPFMSFGDRVSMRGLMDDGRAAPFGAIDQRVVQSKAQGKSAQ